MNITAAQIKNVVLAEDDFGHEMRVGAALNTLKYAISSGISIETAIHGETYEDPVTQKTRQFDYRCRIVNHRNRGIISLAVECKNLNPDFPLVICGRPRTQRESYHVAIAWDGINPRTLQITGQSSIYRPHELVGKSILRLKIKEKKLCSDGDSEIYDRWAQALASSNDLAVEAAQKPSSGFRIFVMPMVVVPNGSLWTVNYNFDGDVASDPQQVQTCEFYVAHKIDIGPPFLITHIHFLTLDGLRSFFTEFANGDFYKWDRIFSIDATEFKGVS
jgi:hypothetical protein